MKTTDNTERTWLTTREACEHMNISRSFLRGLVNKGHINKYNLSPTVARYDRREIDEYIRKGAQAI